MDICILGNLENRRVSLFKQAAEQLGATVECYGWLEILNRFLDCQDRGQAWLTDNLSKFDLVRIESLGENQAVEAALLNLVGVIPQDLQIGEIRYLREYHAGFCKLMGSLSKTTARFQNSPESICAMFDKWESVQRFSDAGLSRVKTMLAPKDLDSFFQFRHEFAYGQSARQGRIFLKPQYSSSASGVCAYRWRGDQEQLIAPIEIARTGGQTRLFNSLKVRSYTNIKDITAILANLLPQQMIAEKWIPKLSLNSRRCDLRIVVINGQPRHCVVRKSSSPMTNLHLGNQRGTLEELTAQIGSEKLAQCYDLAAEAFQCYTDVTYAGVDIMLDSRRRPLVGEINAFGDLLPGVLHHEQSTYEAIAEAATMKVAALRSGKADV